ncbi:hypothetical protein K8I61_07395 [bacterium]|nr:hypothetical protein [bacterium]
MKILITHLTRMHHDTFCAAGIDMVTGEHVRPCVARRNLPAEMLLSRGGIFSLGAKIVLNYATPRHEPPPHVEDWLFEPRAAYLAGTVSPDDLWERLDAIKQRRLQVLFGKYLTIVERNAVVEPGRGTFSLGCYAPASPPVLRIEKRSGQPSLRLHLDANGNPLNLSVTDLRFYKDDLATIDRKRVDAVQELLRGGETLLCLGLTREFAKSREEKPVHWLQVNNIFPKSNPLF